jgi:alcohol dehydrogenase
MTQESEEPAVQPSLLSFRANTRLLIGEGSISQLGATAQELGSERALVVSDEGVLAAGHTRTGVASLQSEGIETAIFSQFTENPTTAQVHTGTVFAKSFRPDLIIGLGGGSSMDCAKGINFLLCCGGQMKDYRGRGTTGRPLLPSIGCPTTAGTGSETQSFALISDTRTGEKFACGDPNAAFRVAILDPCLTVTQPTRVTALTGIDALSHALESHVSTEATRVSQVFSREAWKLLIQNLPKVFLAPTDIHARAAVQLGAAWAGLAIENAMLGATHGAANPLTAKYKVAHGQAVGLMLPHIIRFNGPVAREQYAELAAIAGLNTKAPDTALANWIHDLLGQAGLSRSLGEVIGSQPTMSEIEQLAKEASAQWTSSFNPRPCLPADFIDLYRRASA